MTQLAGVGSERGRAAAAAAATVSSLKSEDSTQELICKTPQDKLKHTDNVKKGKSVSCKSVEAGSEAPARRRSVVVLGLCQVLLGALLVGAGATAVVRGAELSRTGAGLWAGCVSVVAGVVGVLAGINDCYGLHADNSSGPLVTAFLALSLLSLACGNSAAVLAAAGLQRDARRPLPPHSSFQDEMQAWSPVLANIALLIIATVHCLVCVVSIYHLSKRVCPCLRPKLPFDHNQFDPTYKTAQAYVIHVDEVRKAHDAEKIKNHELCKELEEKLQGETLQKKKVESEPECGSENSKEKLVSRWLGRGAAGAAGAVGASGASGASGAAGRARRPSGVRKSRKPRAPPLVLLPAHPAHAAHPASTLGRMPVSVVLPPRYATLPLPPPAYGPPPTLYYPLPDNRVRRGRAARAARAGGRRGRRGPAGPETDSQLTRSLERIHRQRRADQHRTTDNDLRRTYTGLDREYAEQFIAVCDESRHAAEQHDSLASTSATSDSSRTAAQRDSL